MPGEGALRETAGEVGVAQRLAEREHGVVAGQIAAPDLFGRGDRPVVGVVKEELVAASLQAVGADPSDQPVRGPLVDQDELGAFEDLVEIDRRGVVTTRIDHRIRRADVGDRGLALLGEQVLRAPRVLRLERDDIVPAH